MLCGEAWQAEPRPRAPIGQAGTGASVPLVLIGFSSVTSCAGYHYNMTRAPVAGIYCTGIDCYHEHRL